jgi:hypothetical protein
VDAVCDAVARGARPPADRECNCDVFHVTTYDDVREVLARGGCAATDAVRLADAMAASVTVSRFAVREGLSSPPPLLDGVARDGTGVSVSPSPLFEMEPVRDGCRRIGGRNVRDAVIVVDADTAVDCDTAVDTQPVVCVGDIVGTNAIVIDAVCE